MKSKSCLLMVLGVFVIPIIIGGISGCGKKKKDEPQTESGGSPSPSPSPSPTSSVVTFSVRTAGAQLPIAGASVAKGTPTSGGLCDGSSTYTAYSGEVYPTGADGSVTVPVNVPSGYTNCFRFIVSAPGYNPVTIYRWIQDSDLPLALSAYLSP